MLHFEQFCLATCSLFAALGSRIISFANLTMFLAEEKRRLYSAIKDKTIPQAT